MTCNCDHDRDRELLDAATMARSIRITECGTFKRRPDAMRTTGRVIANGHGIDIEVHDGETGRDHYVDGIYWAIDRRFSELVGTIF